LPPAARPGLQPFGRRPERPAAVLLVLHGGSATGRGRAHPLRLAYLRMVPVVRALARATEPANVAVSMLRYRIRGWNGDAADALRDTELVLDRLAERHPGVPVALVGHSMGARAALLAAGAPTVTAVCALAPWVESSDPVRQLVGRAVLIAHGDRDRITDPAGSLAYAARARAVTPKVCRFELPGDGHAMLRRRHDWADLTRRFVLGELGLEPVDPLVWNAYRQPIPRGLRVELSAER
jgi:dienelactone hydrolase